MASRFVITLLTLLVLAACAGGTRQIPIVPSVAQSVASRGHGALSLRVTIPRFGMSPDYVGPSTKGMTVNITGPSNVKETVGLTVTSNGCKSKLMTLVCTLDVPNLLACPTNKNCYVGTVTTYDAFAHGKIPHNAHALSQDVKFGFKIGSTPTVVPMVLYGIPKSVKLFPGDSSTLTGSQKTGFVLPKCSVAPQSVDLVAADADGNFIVGVGEPKVALSSDDPSQLKVSGGKGGEFKLSPPAAPAYPFGGHTIHLTAKATAPKGGGGTSATTAVAVTYSGDICGTITEFPVPSGITSEPFGITVGPDGALWFAEYGVAKIGRITTTGTFHEFTGLTANSQPLAIVTGPDRNLWFVEQQASKIGRMTTTGGLVEYTTLTASSQPTVIVSGPDGRLWFTEKSGNNVGVISVAGSMHEYPIPTASATLEGITVGPDRALWFTELLGDKIGRITTDGLTITETPVAGGSNPIGIVTGSDGKLWIAANGVNAIERLAPNASGTGAVDAQVPLPEVSSGPLIDALGPDGNVWFTEATGNRVASIDEDGRVTEYAVPTGGGGPAFVTTGPDGAIWFTELATGKIGRLR